MQRTSRARCATCRKSDRCGMHGRARAVDAGMAASGRMADRTTSITRSSMGRSSCCIAGCAERSDGSRGFQRAVTGSEYRKRVRDHVQTAHRPCWHPFFVWHCRLARPRPVPLRCRRPTPRPQPRPCRHRRRPRRSAASAWRHIWPGRATGPSVNARPTAPSRCATEMIDADVDRTLRVTRWRTRIAVAVRRCVPSSIVPDSRRQAFRPGAHIACPASTARPPSQ